MNCEHQRRHQKTKSTAVRQRVTPTYYHHKIFNQDDLQTHKQRVTPTFVSTVFDTQGYNIITNHSRVVNKKQPNNQTQEVVVHRYNNVSRDKKIASLYPCNNVAGQSRYGNHTALDYKEQIAKDINGAGGKTSRMRKCLEQMSDPVFGGYVWEPKIVPRQNAVKQDRISHKEQEKQTTLNPNANDKNRIIETPKITHNKSQNVLKPSLKQEKQEAPLQKPVYEQNKVQVQKNDPSKNAQTIANKKPNNAKHQNNLKKLKSANKLCTHNHNHHNHNH